MAGWRPVEPMLRAFPHEVISYPSSLRHMLTVHAADCTVPSYFNSASTAVQTKSPRTIKCVRRTLSLLCSCGQGVCFNIALSGIQFLTNDRTYLSIQQHLRPAIIGAPLCRSSHSSPIVELGVRLAKTDPATVFGLVDTCLFLSKRWPD